MQYCRSLSSSSENTASSSPSGRPYRWTARSPCLPLIQVGAIGLGRSTCSMRSIGQLVWPSMTSGLSLSSRTCAWVWQAMQWLSTAT